MTTYKIKGPIVFVGDIIEKANGFKKRTFVIDATENPNYNNPVELTLKKDRVSDIANHSVGDVVEVEFTVDGRQWDSPNGTRYFVDLNAWHIRLVGETTAKAAPAAPSAQPSNGATMEQAQAAYMAVFHDEKGFGPYCLMVRPDVAKVAKLAGMRFSEWAKDRPRIWADIIAKIKEDERATAEEEALPF